VPIIFPQATELVARFTAFCDSGAFGVVATALDVSTKLLYVSTGMGDRLRAGAYHLGIIPATQTNSAWPSLRGYVQ